MARRILIVCRHFWPEPARVNDLCERLAAVGYKIDVLCGQPSDENGSFRKGYNGYKVRRETHNKINIYRTIDVKKGTDSNISIFLNYITFPLTSFLQTRKLARHQYSAVLVYQISPVMMSAPGLRIGKKQGIPVYLYVADLWPQHVYSIIDVQSSLFRKFLTALSMRYYRSATKLIVTSPAMRKYFADRLGMMDAQLPVVTRDPDPVWQSDLRDDSLMEKLAGGFHLLITGDWNGQLSVKTVMRVAQMLREGDGRNIRFVVLGDGARIRELQKQTAAEGMEDLFFFEGKAAPEDLGKYLHITDILTVIVKPEGENEYTVPQEMVNLIAAGKPIVASLSEYTRDMIREAGCGYTTEPEDAAGIFQGIMEIYRMTPEKRLEMGQRALSWQQMHYCREKNGEKLAWILAGEEIPDDGASEDSASSIRKLWEF